MSKNYVFTIFGNGFKTVAEIKLDFSETKQSEERESYLCLVDKKQAPIRDWHFRRRKISLSETFQKLLTFDKRIEEK